MTATAPHLRVVTEDDWEMWRDLRREVLSTDPDAFGSTLETEEQYTEAQWRARVSRGRAVVAMVGDEPVGMGGLYYDAPGSALVVSMWVSPSHRGRGIGRLVLDDLVASARADGLRVRLWVTQTNSARRFYERAGFVDLGEREPLRAGSPIIKVRMQLP